MPGEKAMSGHLKAFGWQVSQEEVLRGAQFDLLRPRESLKRSRDVAQAAAKGSARGNPHRHCQQQAFWKAKTMRSRGFQGLKALEMSICGAFCDLKWPLLKHVQPLLP